MLCAAGGQTRPDIDVITANPKTAGVARWNFLALWGHRLDKGEAAALDYVTKVMHLTTSKYLLLMLLPASIFWASILCLSQSWYLAERSTHPCIERATKLQSQAQWHARIVKACMTMPACGCACGRSTCAKGSGNAGFTCARPRRGALCSTDYAAYMRPPLRAGL
jgi:hypothetical protein